MSKKEQKQTEAGTQEENLLNVVEAIEEKHTDYEKLVLHYMKSLPTKYQDLVCSYASFTKWLYETEKTEDQKQHRLTIIK